MIVGSGLIANAFSPVFAKNDNVVIYAAGVSNSSCTDEKEFKRERIRLSESLKNTSKNKTFVYFGTCSVADPVAIKMPYVQHKLAMEEIVYTHPNNLIFRLPQVAGKTPNPHTLLNFLYAHISRSEKFNLWKNAKRNIIDVEDVAAIASQLISDSSKRNITVNIANEVNYLIIDIVNTMEMVLGKRAIYDVINDGSEYNIDINEISSVLGDANVHFSNNYLKNIIEKYYANYFRIVSG